MQTLGKRLIAGAAGTCALNLVTYLDMAVRARAASSTPAETVGKLAEMGGVGLGEKEQAENRKEALGALVGYATGAGAAVCYGMLASKRRVPWPVGVLALTALAMVGSNGPMTALGITDPREWSASSWASDVVPHLAYGVTAYSAYELMK
ncbi:MULTISPECIES: hypothetical protein [Nonomuraea]|uniref:DUF1440 domain-containing protein n=1 Tax=Nonomuraea salmonea TaxID=46181 RepID=A0ABV5NEW5_9ACTN